MKLKSMSPDLIIIVKSYFLRVGRDPKTGQGLREPHDLCLHVLLVQFLLLRGQGAGRGGGGGKCL